MNGKIGVADGDLGALGGLWLMAAILLLAFGIGATNLNADPVWLDELASLTAFGVFDPYFNPADVMEAISRYTPADVPAFAIIGAAWARLAGFSQFALRLYPLLLGALTLAMVYRFAADVFDRRTGVVAAFLMAGNAFALIYFHELRNYTLFMFVSALYVWLYWRLTRRTGATRRARFLFPLASVALVYTHAYGGILIAALALYHIFRKPKDRVWLEIVLAWALAALMMLPFLQHMTAGVALVTNDGAADPPLEVAGALLHLLANGADWLWLLVVPLVAYAWRRTRNSNLLLVTALALAAAGLLLLAHTQFALITTTRIRHFLFVWFLLMTSLAYALTSLRRWLPITLVFCAFWLLAGARFGVSRDLGGHYFGTPWMLGRVPPLHEYVAQLRDKVQEQDFLLGFYDVYDVNFLWEVHSAGSQLDYYLGAQLGIEGRFLHGSKKQYRLDGDVREVMQARPHLILAHDPAEEPLNYARVLRLIEVDFAPCPPLVQRPRLQAQKYRHALLSCDGVAAPVEFDNGVGLIDRAAHYEAETQKLSALMWWRLPLEDMLDDFNISLQVFGADGEKALQLDRHLDAALAPWGLIELSTVDLPAGVYQLTLILYEREGGAKISGVDATSGESGKFIALAKFEIATA